MASSDQHLVGSLKPSLLFINVIVYFLVAFKAGKRIHLPSVMCKRTLVFEGQTLLSEDDDGKHHGERGTGLIQAKVHRTNGKKGLISTSRTDFPGDLLLYTHTGAAIPGKNSACLLGDVLTLLLHYTTTVLLGNTATALLWYVLAFLQWDSATALPKNMKAVFPGNLTTILLWNLLALLPGNLVAGLLGNLGAAWGPSCTPAS